MMKMQNTIHNALNTRGLKELPPPLCKLTGITTTPRDTATSPLLHQASASCGRVFVCLLLTLFLLTFTACEKEVSSTDISVHATMQAFYAERRMAWGQMAWGQENDIKMDDGRGMRDEG